MISPSTQPAKRTKRPLLENKKAGPRILLGVPDQTQLMAFLDDLSMTRYDVMSKSTNEYRSNISAKTVKRVFKNGHLDSDVWMYVNPMHQEKVPAKSGKGVYTIWTPIPNASSFVLDFDNCPFAASIEEMLAFLKSRGSRLPMFITMTSERSFHLAYAGLKSNFKKSDVFGFAFKLLGVKTVDGLRSFGLDINYLKQDFKKHKFRVGGSINSKKKGFVCQTWINKEDLGENEQDFYPTKPAEPQPAQEATTAPPTEATVTKKPTKLRPKINKNTLTLIYEKISQHMSKKLARKIARALAHRSGFLSNNYCAISQKELAKELKVTQPYVSALLKKLIALNIIKITNSDFNFLPDHGQVRCREYAFTEDFRNYLHSKNERIKERIIESLEELKTDYVPGERNEMFMADVRHLRYFNIPVSEKIDFLQAKLSDYAKHNRKPLMSEKDIEYTIENFDSKALDLPTINLGLASDPRLRVIFNDIGIKPRGLQLAK